MVVVPGRYLSLGMKYSPPLPNIYLLNLTGIVSCKVQYLVFPRRFQNLNLFKRFGPQSCTMIICYQFCRGK